MLPGFPVKSRVVVVVRNHCGFTLSSRRMSESIATRNIGTWKTGEYVVGDFRIVCILRVNHLCVCVCVCVCVCDRERHYGRVKVYLYAFLTAAWQNVSEELHATAALPLGKIPCYPFRRAGWAWLLWTRWTREKFIFPAGNRTTLSQSSSSSSPPPKRSFMLN
jgi:hypothetical protein